MRYFISALLIALVAGCEPPSHPPPRATGQGEQREPEMAPGVPRSRIRGNEAYYLTPTCAAFSPDGKQVLVGYDGYGGASEPENWPCLDLWDTATGQQLRNFIGHKQKVNFVAILPDGKRAVSASRDDTLRLWDLGTGRQLRSVAVTARVQYGFLTPDGKTLLVGNDMDPEVRLLESDTFRVKKSLHPSGAGYLTALSVSADSRWALSGHGPSQIRRISAILWDLKSGEEVRSFPTAEEWIAPGIISPDGSQALFTRNVGKLGVDQHMRTALVDLKTGKTLQTFPQEWGGPVAWFPDGKRVIYRPQSFGSSKMALYDLTTDQDVWSVVVEHSPAGIAAAAASPDHKLLFTASGSYVIGGDSRARLNLWDTANGHFLRPFERPWPP